MPGDIVSSKYPTINAALALVPGLSNVANPYYPVRSNLEWNLGSITDGALAATGVGAFVAVPWDAGQTVSKISLVVGGTAEATGTHAFMALYSGIATPALLSQAPDETGAAAYAASGIHTVTLTTAQTITAAQAPNGFVYALVAVTATTVPTALSVGSPTGVNFAWTTGSPSFLAGTAGSALGATAAATIASPSAKAVGPVMFLS
jgi:hypothetical protein